jgi:hypothetical protein
MVPHMLLDRVVDPQMPRDFRVHFVPGPADLTFQIAAKRRQVFIELLAGAAQRVGAAHAFMRGHVVPILVTAFAATAGLYARPLDDHARHVFTHGVPPEPRSKQCKSPVRPYRSTGIAGRRCGLAD